MEMIFFDGWTSLLRTLVIGVLAYAGLGNSGLAFADTHFEREAQLAILIGSLLAAAVGIALLQISKATPAPGPK